MLGYFPQGPEDTVIESDPRDLENKRFKSWAKDKEAELENQFTPLTPDEKKEQLQD